MSKTPSEWIAQRGPHKFARYFYRDTDFYVEHCGHPTANFPYLVFTDQGDRILAPNGRGFQYLETAKQVCAGLANGSTPHR